MSMHFHSPRLSGKPFSVDGGKAAVPAWGSPLPVQTLTLRGGRLNAVPGTLTGMPAGAVAPRDDGQTSVQLRGVSQAQSVSATLDGQPVQVEILPQSQAGGFDPGKHYMLPVNAQGRIDAEPGRNHRKLYVSMSPASYTKAKIATEAGVAESAVTNAWLRANPLWGATPEKALHASIGAAFWLYLVGGGANRPAEGINQSNWLLLERGYDYSAYNNGYGNSWTPSGMSGESPIHPCIVKAYGTGAKPKLPFLACWQASLQQSWYVIEDVEVPKIEYAHHADALFSHIDVIGGKAAFISLNPHARWPHRTLYRSKCLDSSWDAPFAPNTNWDANRERTSGVYGERLESFLLMENLFDHNGWSEGYNPTTLSGAFPKPPEKFSHNVYLQQAFKGITFLRNISGRASSIGMMNRPGGHMIDNMSIDDEIGMNSLSSGLNGIGTGQWAYLVGNLMVSTGQRPSFVQNDAGAKTWGIDLGGKDGVLVDNVIMHLTDPDNPTEYGKPTTIGQAVTRIPTLFDNTRVHRWDPQKENAAIYNRDVAALNNASIQKRAGSLLGKASGTIAEYFGLLRTMDGSQWVAELEAAMAYFKTPWGLHIPKRTVAQTVKFRPHEYGEGFRWDNRLNWSTGDHAGTISGDNVEVYSDFLMFNTFTVVLGTLNMRGARLEASSGKMTVAQIQNCPQVRTSFCGQITVAADTAVDHYMAMGGRLRFTGAVSGHDLSVGAVEWEGRYPPTPHLAMTECLLGPDHTIAAGRTMLLDGPSWTGWNGTGRPKLTIEAGGKLRFQAYLGALPQIRVFKMGFDDGTATAAPTITLNGAVEVDTTGVAPGTYDLTGPGITVVNNAAALPASVTVTGGKLVLTVS